MSKKRQNLPQVILPKRVKTIRCYPTDFLSLTMPYRKVEGVVYERESKSMSLTIQSGYNSETKEYYGIPYGIYPRLIMYFICSEVRRTGSKEIYLGKSVQEVLEKLSITEKGVRNNGKVLKTFKDQLLRLTGAVITITDKKLRVVDKDRRISQDSIKIIKKIEFWKESTKIDYKLTLTEDFYKYLMNSSSTVFEADRINEIKSSPASLDLYILLNYKSYIASRYNKEIYIPFKKLYESFGTSDSFRSFKQNIKKNLLTVLDIYPEFNIKIEDSSERNGIIVKKDSNSTIQPDLFFSNFLEE